MPASVKSIPENRWAWDLKEKLESAHSFVRENVPGAMLRQKALHDQKTSWQRFEPDDEAYVYFPRYLPGQSPKLASFWKGPFKVLDKCSDVTYKVLCGQRGTPQIIYVDRIRAKKSQVLENEVHESSLEQAPSSRTSDDVIIDIEDVDPVESLAPDNNTRRRRRRPPWMSDYVTEF